MPEVEPLVWRGVGHADSCNGRGEVMELLEGGLEDGLGELGGVDVHGQLFNVFRVSDGKIVAVQDYAHRDEALLAAGADAPRWR